MTAADRPAEPTPPTNDVLTDVKVVAGEPTPTGADRPTTDAGREVAEVLIARNRLQGYGAYSEPHAYELVRRIEAEARQQPQPLDVDVLTRAYMKVRTVHDGDDFGDGPEPCEWCKFAVQQHLEVLRVYARLSSGPARPSPTEEPRKVEPLRRGRCEFWLSERSMCGKDGRWLVDGTIRCGEHKDQEQSRG